MWISSYPSGLTCVLGAQKNRLIETVLLSTYNINFGLEIRDENSQSFSIRKICRLTSKWRKAIFKSLISRHEKVQDWSRFPDWALAYDLYNASCFCWNLFLNEVKLNLRYKLSLNWLGSIDICDFRPLIRDLKIFNYAFLSGGLSVHFVN